MRPVCPYLCVCVYSRVMCSYTDAAAASIHIQRSDEVLVPGFEQSVNKRTNEHILYSLTNTHSPTHTQTARIHIHKSTIFATQLHYNNFHIFPLCGCTAARAAYTHHPQRVSTHTRKMSNGNGSRRRRRYL